MDFGRTDDPDAVDWRLPGDAAPTGQVLDAARSSSAPPGPGKPQIRIGAPRWGVKEWRGRLYPQEARPAEYLRYYGHRFAAVELNATFYKIPTDETIARWREMVPETFRFCPKIPQSISHSSDLDSEGRTRDRFFAAVRRFEDRLGPCFLMLPPRFAPSRLSILEHFLDAVPSGVGMVVEFRHPDFFQPGTAGEIFAALSSRGVGTVITDTGGRRDALHMRLTTPTAFIRFVGNAPHPTDGRRVEEWVSRLRRWAASGLEELYFFIHQPKEGHTLDLAGELEEMLGEAGLTYCRSV